MEDEKVRQKGPFLLREETHQLLLYFHRILLRAQPQQPGQPSNVGVDRDSFIQVERVSQDHVRGLAADPRQRRSSSIVRVLPPWSATSACAMPIRLRLVPEEAGRFDDLFDFGREARASSRRRIRAKRTGVTMFTRASVHCAERIVAQRSSKAFR